jgi:hypothetical protein
MRHDDFLDAFRRLGQRLTEPARLVLAGGSAMILLGYMDRDTGVDETGGRSASRSR